MKKPHHPKSAPQSGFTLVELLVAIAIIAVLAAILFSGVKAMRNAADTATCVSNQRQIVAGMVAWVQENNNIMPEYVRKVGSDGGGYYWYADMSYASRSPGGNQLPPAPHKPLRAGESPGIWVCPANDPFSISQTSRSISYTMNSRTFGPKRRYLQMTRPGHTIAICDANFAGPNNYRILSDADIGHVHNGGAVAAFWDGHVEKLNPFPEFSSSAFSFTAP